MLFLDSIQHRARAKRQIIALAEGEDPRIIEAARRATDEAVAHCVLVGDEAAIRTRASEIGIDLDGIRCIDPQNSADRDRFRSRGRYACGGRRGRKALGS